MHQSRFYVSVTQEQRGLIGKVRDHFEKNFRKRFSQWQKGGGGSGDLYEEIAQLDEYWTRNRASIQLYTIEDNHCNGYREFVSVLILLPEFSEEEKPEVEELTQFLTEQDFVTSHKHLRERPAGGHDFEPYLDEWYRPEKKLPFTKE